MTHLIAIQKDLNKYKKQLTKANNEMSDGKDFILNSIVVSNLHILIISLEKAITEINKANDNCELRQRCFNELKIKNERIKELKQIGFCDEEIKELTINL